MQSSVQFALTSSKKSAIIMSLSIMMLLFRRRGSEGHGPIGTIPWMMGSFRLLIRNFLLTAFRKPLCTRSPKKPVSSTGAIYTRYKNKDALFASLLQDFFETMQVLFAPIAEEYEKAKCSAQPEDILRAINAEEQVYFRLLTEHHALTALYFSAAAMAAPWKPCCITNGSRKRNKRWNSFRISMGKRQMPMRSVF